MTDQLLTQHFILLNLPVSYPETRTSAVQPHQVRPMEAGYEYDELELAEELAAARRRQPLRISVEVNPGVFEALYKWFLS